MRPRGLPVSSGRQRGASASRPTATDRRARTLPYLWATALGQGSAVTRMLTPAWVTSCSWICRDAPWWIFRDAPGGSVEVPVVDLSGSPDTALQLSRHLGSVPELEAERLAAAPAATPLAAELHARDPATAPPASDSEAAVDRAAVAPHDPNCGAALHAAGRGEHHVRVEGPVAAVDDPGRARSGAGRRCRGHAQERGENSATKRYRFITAG